MKSFKIKINNQYISGFKQSEIELENGVGGWYSERTLQTLTCPTFGKPKIFEGNTNLKSGLDKILKWEKETKEIVNLEIIATN